MATAPSSPAVRTPQLVLGVTDASQNRSKQFIPSAYAVGKLFTGVALPENIDLNTYLTPGVSRVNTYKNGPPVTSPGYLVIHSVNPDEDKSGIGVRYRQIYYPDSTTETTPYTRVGTGTSSDAITWSTWTTMGGNWVCELLGGNKTAIVNYMYHSFGDWTLTLPDPTAYVQGTRIGLTQWSGSGSVVYGTQSQSTTPDIDSSGKIIGSLQYIFQIVPDENGENRWSVEVDANPAKTFEDLRNSLQSNIDSLSDRHDEEMQNMSDHVDSVESTITAAINTERSERIAADNTINAELERLDADKRRDMKVLPNVTSATFVFNTSATSNNLGKYDYHVMVRGSGTITLPTNVTTQGVRVVLHIQPSVTTTVVAGSISESFTNSDASAILVIDMQVIATSVNNQYTWTVLEIG